MTGVQVLFVLINCNSHTVISTGRSSSKCSIFTYFYHSDALHGLTISCWCCKFCNWSQNILIKCHTISNLKVSKYRKQASWLSPNIPISTGGPTYRLSDREELKQSKMCCDFQLLFSKAHCSSCSCWDLMYIIETRGDCSSIYSHTRDQEVVWKGGRTLEVGFVMQWTSVLRIDVSPHMRIVGVDGYGRLFLPLLIHQHFLLYITSTLFLSDDGAVSISWSCCCTDSFSAFCLDTNMS